MKSLKKNCIFKSIFYTQSLQWQKARHIIVHSPNWIGDQIMAYAFFYHLRRLAPDAWIEVLTRPWVRSIQYRGFVNEIKELSNDSLFKLICKRNPKDQCFGFNLSCSWRAYWWLKNQGAQQVHTVYHPRSLKIHRSLAYLNLLNIVADTSAFDPKQHWSTQPIQTPEEKYFIIAPASKAPTRTWPLERFVQLAHKIQMHTNWRCVILADHDSHDFISAFSCLKKVTNHIGKSSVGELWGLFQTAQMTVTNDSGLAHVAALSGGRVHIIWGAGEPKRTLAKGSKVTVSIAQPACWPCEKNTCSNRSFACLLQTDVQSVFQQLFE